MMSSQASKRIGPFSGKKIHYNKTSGQAIFHQKHSGTDAEKIISANNTNYKLDYFGMDKSAQEVKVPTA